MRATTTLVLTAIFLGTTVSCTNGDVVTARRLQLPTQYSYGSLLWFPDGTLWIGAYNESQLDGFWYIDSSDNQLHQLPLNTTSECKRIDYPRAEVLPDGRLGIVQRCYHRWPDRPSPLGDESYFVAYDVATSSQEYLVDDPLLASDIGGNFTWNPTVTLGIQETMGLYGMLYWLRPDGISPITVTVGSGNQAWALDENYVAVRDHLDMENTGVARAPAWSPDGQYIAFLATSDAIGNGSPKRTDGEWQLYLMALDDITPRSLLGGIYQPTTMRWSPNGQWLAFLGQAGIWHKQGIWLYAPFTDTLHFVAQGEFGSMAWSPDSQMLVATTCTDDKCKQREVWEYDLGKIVQIGK